jgi:3-hydroxyisobutyrate dehydrogenase
MSNHIAFIGVGNMGNPMANQLVKAGKDVKVFDVSQDVIKIAKQSGLDVINSMEELLQGATTVISMLPEGKHVRSLYLGDNGILKKIPKDCLIIDCSTIDIETSLELGNAAKKIGINMIDAPVTGGVMGARIGKLNFLVGGSDEAVAIAKPLFDIMGQKILHAGAQGSGVGVKICNNMSLGISMIASAEALMLAKRLKMDVKKVHSIIKEASGNNWAMTNYTPLPNLTEGVPSNNKYRPGFSAAMMTKDLKLANDAAKSVDASTPLGKAALEIFSDFCKTVIVRQITLVYQKKLVEMLGIIHLIQKVLIKTNLK